MEIKKNSNYIFLFLYPVTIILSCVVNRNNIQYTQVARGCTGALLMMDVFLVLKRYEREYNSEKLTDVLYKLSRFYAFANVIWIIALILAGNLHKAVSNDFLFSKGKFPTAYMFVFYLMFFSISWKGNSFIQLKLKKLMFIIMAIGCMGLCALIETSTGIIAIFALLCFTFFGWGLTPILKRPIVMIGLIIGSMFFVLLLASILQISFIQNIIVNILHEDLSLTGRMSLYKMLFPLILKSGLWGGGFGSYVAATLSYHGWYNAQNGLAEIILTYGFCGGLTFLIMVFASFFNAKNQNRMIYLTILTFVLVAVVEIPFNGGFILLLSLLQLNNSEELERGKG